MSTQATAAGDFLSPQKRAPLSRAIGTSTLTTWPSSFASSKGPARPHCRGAREKLKGQINHWISTADAFRGSPPHVKIAKLLKAERALVKARDEITAINTMLGPGIGPTLSQVFPMEAAIKTVGYLVDHYRREQVRRGTRRRPRQGLDQARLLLVSELVQVYEEMTGRAAAFTREGSCAKYLAQVLSRCERKRIAPKAAYESWGRVRKLPVGNVPEGEVYEVGGAKFVIPRDKAFDARMRELHEQLATLARQSD